MDKVPSDQIREMFGVMKRVDERIEESVLQRWGMIEFLEGYLWKSEWVVN